jgi:hypothetical protein
MARQKRKIGRPAKWESPERLQRLVDEYFDSTPLEKQMITGLALHLDTNRETLCSYEDKDDFSDTIKKAKARIEMAYELRGLEKGTAFDIFRLKNMGWRDKYDHDVTERKAKEAIPDDELEKIAKG